MAYLIQYVRTVTFRTVHFQAVRFMWLFRKSFFSLETKKLFEIWLYRNRFRLLYFHLTTNAVEVFDILYERPYRMSKPAAYGRLCTYLPKLLSWKVSDGISSISAGWAIDNRLSERETYCRACSKITASIHPIVYPVNKSE